MPKQTYQYKQQESILFGLRNTYELTDGEYRILYTFFVTYSLCKSSSWQRKDLKFYGWNGSYKDTVKELVEGVLGPDALVVVGNDKPAGTLKQEMSRMNLHNGRLDNLDKERAVIVDNHEDNKFYNLCRHIRNCFAHGKFALVYSTKGRKMIIFQDDNVANVTGRMVFSLETLFAWISIVDRNKVLQKS